jgi:hypothetical protein
LAAKEAYERVLRTTPDHSKVLQHLGGLYLRTTVPFHNPEKCAEILAASLEHGKFALFFDAKDFRRLRCGNACPVNRLARPLHVVSSRTSFYANDKLLESL